MSSESQPDYRQSFCRVSGLSAYIGRREFYALDDNAFWGELKCLDPCVSTIYKLPALRDRSTLRGVLSILGEIPTDRRLLSYYLNLNA
jgi:hypothetical protein